MRFACGCAQAYPRLKPWASVCRPTMWDWSFELTRILASRKSWQQPYISSFAGWGFSLIQGLSLKGGKAPPRPKEGRNGAPACKYISDNELAGWATRRGKPVLR